MKDVMLGLVDVPIVRMFVLAGILFLMIAVLGKVEGKIEPGRLGRIGAVVVGIILILIGMVMQYTENQGMYARLNPSLVAALPVAPLAVVPATTSAPAPVVPIKVVAGHYGRNCNGKPGNATAALAKSCDGQAQCDFLIDPATLDDPSPTCSKDFAAEWKCGDGNAVYSAALSALSGKGDKLRLSCAN